MRMRKREKNCFLENIGNCYRGGEEKKLIKKRRSRDMDENDEEGKKATFFEKLLNNTKNYSIENKELEHRSKLFETSNECQERKIGLLCSNGNSNFENDGDKRENGNAISRFE